MDRLRFAFLNFVLNFGLIGASGLYGDVDNLFAHLFNETRYKKYIRPVKDQTKATAVNISLVLIKIKKFDLSTGSMVSNGYLQISWYDELLVWNPASFGGIKKLYVPHGYNWKPGLAFSKHSEESLTFSSVFAPSWVSNDGRVVSAPGSQFETICEVDTTQYPFDSHLCNYEILSTDYDSSEVMLHSSHPKVILDQFVENGEWYLRDTICKAGTMLDTSKSDQSSSVSNILFIQRRPAFVMIHALSPLFFIDALCIVVCLVPVDSGERISYSVTVFLSFVFLSGTIIADLPRNSLKLTTISWELITVNFLSTMTVLWSVYIVRLYRRRGQVSDLPRVFLFACYFVKRISKCVSIPNKKLNCRQRKGSQDSVNESEAEFNHKLAMEGKNDFQDEELKWQDTIKALDKAYFIFNLMCYIIMCVAIVSVFAAYIGGL